MNLTIILFIALFAVLFIFFKQYGYTSPIVWFIVHSILYYGISPLFESKLVGKNANLAINIGIMTSVLTLMWALILSRFSEFQKIVNLSYVIERYIEKDVRTIRNRILIVNLLGVGIYVFVVIFVYKSSLAGVFSNPLGFRRFLSQGINNLFFTYMVILMFNSFYFYLAYRYQFAKKFLNLHVILYLIFLFIIALSFGSRGIVINVAFTLVVLYEFYRKPLALFKLLIVGLIGMFILVKYGEYRATGQNDDGTKNENVIESLSNTFLNIDDLGNIITPFLSRFDALSNFNLYLKKLEKGDVKPQLFESFVNAPIQLIPRNFLPEKPYYFSTEMTRKLYPDVFNDGVTYDFSGMAEFIHNFSLGLLPLFAIIPGFILAIAYKMYMQGSKLVTYILIYFPLCNLPVALINNGFVNSSNVVFFPLTYINLILCFLIFVKYKFGNANYGK